MLSYHTRKKRQRKKWKKIFLLSALRIPCLLLHNYTADTRCNFDEDHPYLAKLYRYLLELLSKELKLPIKRCKSCKISFLPNHCIKERQENCPYGCVELNRREKTRMAKSRYRSKKEVKFMVAEYNGRYRERKRNGLVSKTADLYKIKTERKLKKEIKLLYKKLNPGTNSKKLRQLDRILRKLSRRISSTV